MFINREKELQILENEYKSTSFSFSVLYGRRRVGKTTLLKKYMQDKDAIYFLVILESKPVILKKFQTLIAEFFNDDFLKNVVISDISKLFEYIVSKNYDKKLIIVIDEFQYLSKIDSSTPSQFQYIVDEILKAKNIHLILSSSAYLYDEPRYILQNEVNESITYFSILEVIASGEHKIGHIASKLGKNVQNITSFQKYELLKCGRWWNKNEEIDVVGVGDDFLIVGECKYSNKKVGIDILEALKKKATKIESNLDIKHFMLFSKSGFTKELLSMSKNNKQIVLIENI